MSGRRWLVMALVVSLLLASCTNGPTPTSGAPTPIQSGVPGFEPADCWFDEPSGQTAECGYLVVPEDRSQPDGKTIKLAVARFKSDSSNPQPDPIVYLEGGPGGSPLRSFIPQFNVLFGPLLEERDLILFDQRGTGYSQPALDCPEYKQVTLDLLDDDIPTEEAEELSNQALLACRERLANEGVNLSAYNSAENAADLNDLRNALGIEQWNLYGISYGTRLALTEIRDFPEGLRSVVIDSVYPPQVSLFASTAANGARAFDVLFESCASDAACNAAFPDLQNVFFDLVERFNREPATFTTRLHSGETYDVVMNGDGLMGLTFQTLYATSLLPYLPRMIYQMRDGNTALPAALEGEFLSQLDDISYGMYYSVQCDEEVPFTTPEELAEATGPYPDYAPLASEDVFPLCQNWGVGEPDPVENEPVRGDVATLILAGEFDPITPPSWGQLAAETLSNSFFFELPNAGHGSSLTVDCPRSLLLAFLDNPQAEPEASCIVEEMAQLSFAAPVGEASIKLVPFAEPSMGIRGVVPEGWKELAPGTFTPSGEITDQTALIQQAAPLGADVFLNFMTTQLEQSGIEASFEEIDNRTANGLEWTIYTAEASISVIDIALAEQGGQTYLVVLQSLIDEREALYNTLFLPAVEALTRDG